MLHAEACEITRTPRNTLGRGPSDVDWDHICGGVELNVVRVGPDVREALAELGHELRELVNGGWRLNSHYRVMQREVVT